jgi:hypothetical protein
MITQTSPSAPTRTRVQIVAGIFGAVFLLVGILGFVPGITQNLDTIMFARDNGGAPRPLCTRYISSCL